MLEFLKNLFKKTPKVEKVDLASRFELIGRVGQGSMSKVWRARDPSTDRMYAIKVLDREKTRKLRPGKNHATTKLALVVAWFSPAAGVARFCLLYTSDAADE